MMSLSTTGQLAKALYLCGNAGIDVEREPILADEPADSEAAARTASLALRLLLLLPLLLRPDAPVPCFSLLRRAADDEDKSLAAELAAAASSAACFRCSFS
mmetsp:Transcript_27233/g.49678  ORF Transcript_27233/g.49678 Transcript_27233/m.49678 type:complete len:101 (+) Transcript_27233:226-528(+)